MSRALPLYAARLQKMLDDLGLPEGFQTITERDGTVWVERDFGGHYARVRVLTNPSHRWFLDNPRDLILEALDKFDTDSRDLRFRKEARDRSGWAAFELRHALRLVEA